jgi:hypothetical protein
MENGCQIYFGMNVFERIVAAAAAGWDLAGILSISALCNL